MATRKSTNSAANFVNAVKGPVLFEVQVLPFNKAALLRPSSSARVRNGAGESKPRIPTTGIAAFCARAASGHAAAPPSNVMNSRRLVMFAAVGIDPERGHEHAFG